MPLFLTQGLTENNTVADGLAQYMQNHTGYERAWLGPWKHVRGNERCSEGDLGLLGDSNCNEDNLGTLKMGREGWFDEVMRFYDRFLKGAKSKVKDPMIAVQTNDGAVARRGRMAAEGLNGLHERSAAGELRRRRG